MGKHLTQDALLAASEGDEHSATRAHLQDCAACRESLAETREGLDLARQASDVPEPSPLYWESFRLQVGRRIAAEGEPSWPVVVWRRFGLASLLPAAAAAALLIAFLPAVGRQLGTVKNPPALLPAWEALPPSTDDAGLLVLQGLAQEGSDLQAATECRSVVDCLGEMNDEESQALADALRSELPEGRS